MHLGNSYDSKLKFSFPRNYNDLHLNICLQKKMCQWGKYFKKAIEILLIRIKYYFLDQCVLSVPTENKKTSDFLMFSEGVERKHLHEMGLKI